MIPFFTAKFYSFILSIAIIAFYDGTTDAATCPAGWISREDPIDSITYGYQVIMHDWMNFYEAQGHCVRAGGQVASIHSPAENAFIASISATLLSQCQNNDSVCAVRLAHTNAGWAFLDSLMRSFWIGMNRVQFRPSYNSTLDCTNSDNTPCDYGRFDAVNDGNSNSPPWAIGCPSGSNSSKGVGDLEYCTEMFNANPTAVWNDISCYQKLGGVVCKMNCSAIKNVTTCPVSSSSVTTKLAATTAVPKATSGGGSKATSSKANSFTTILSSATGSSNSGGNGGCKCKGGDSCNGGGGGYQCGSDDWNWKYNIKTGKAFAYKAFPYNGCYWQGVAICKAVNAVPSSIQSSEENDYIVNTVCSNFLSSNSSRKRRSTSSTCIYTGIHRYTNPATGSVSCSCSDGSPCNYGNGDANGDVTTTFLPSTSTASSTTIKVSNSSITTTRSASTLNLVSTSTASPSNPWAPGCPSNSTTGDSNGYGKKNCIGINGDGKWVDQSCDRPGTAIVCMKECNPPTFA